MCRSRPSPSAAPRFRRTTARYDNSGAVVPTALPTGFEVNDDRDDLGKDPFVLIVEDDPTFASILLDAAHEAGSEGRRLDRRRRHAWRWRASFSRRAITLDLGLADIDGFVLLDLLKHDPETSHIPIHVISGADRSQSVIGMGAFGSHRKAGRARRPRAGVRRRFATMRKSHKPRRKAKTAAARRARFPSSPAPRC